MAEETTLELNQYLTFRLASEVYGVNVAPVIQVLEVPEITKVPRMPEFMSGVINFRGGVVPVVDLRLKFAMSKTERTVDTCIIVMELGLGEEQATVGALADSIEEVIDLDPGDIDPPPRLGTQISTDLISGIGKKEGRY